MLLLEIGIDLERRERLSEWENHYTGAECSRPLGHQTQTARPGEGRAARRIKPLPSQRRARAERERGELAGRGSPGDEDRGPLSRPAGASLVILPEEPKSCSQRRANGLAM